MKKLMTLALGLSLFTGSAVFAADRGHAPDARGRGRNDVKRDRRDAGRDRHDAHNDRRGRR